VPNHFWVVDVIFIPFWGVLEDAVKVVKKAYWLFNEVLTQ